ncbi:type II secretion system F family protein [Patescibacteria group bacterium]
MPVFKFKAKNLEGKEIEGAREAEDKFALARSLRQEKYILVDFEREDKKKKFNLSAINIGGIPFSERMMFTHNLSVMVGAGLPLARALGVLTKQTKNQKFKKTLTDVAESLVKGKSLSESMTKHSKVFPKLYISMVKSGEKSGKLHEALGLVADQMEKEARLKRKVIGAMVYPAIVVVAMIGISILMLVYVVPSLVSTFDELDVELPISTKIIIWLSESIVTNSILLIFIVAVLFFVFIFILRKPKVKALFHTFLLKIPILAPLVQKINSARTARTLSSLIDSGVEILEAITMTSEVVQNVHYKKVLLNAKVDIQKGATISSSFKKADNVFPLLFGEMIAVGEETGKLSEMLLQLAIFFEEEVDDATKNMATVVEPVLMVFIGAAVGFFAVSMIKPMYSMLGSL